MADWGNVQRGLIGGFNVGQAAGGKMAGIGAAIGKIGSMLKEQRVSRQEIEGKKNLLGFAENLRRNAPVSDLDKANTAKILAETANLTNQNAGNLPEGFVSVKGKTYKDPTYKRQETQEELSRELKQDIRKKELTQAASMLPKLDQAVQSIDQLEALYHKGATPDKFGLIARATGPFDWIGAKTGINPDLNNYMDNAKAFSGLIAKGGFGEAGMLTNQDIKRVVSALPGPGSSKSEVKGKFSEIRKLLKNARSNFERTKREYIGTEQSNELNNLKSKYGLD